MATIVKYFSICLTNSALAGRSETTGRSTQVLEADRAYTNSSEK
ncbi:MULTISPECIES: hypothetical protein [Microcoleaceae]|nr:hypothetical protein [Tychonema sp. LEGE 06208]